MKRLAKKGRRRRRRRGGGAEGATVMDDWDGGWRTHFCPAATAADKLGQLITSQKLLASTRYQWAWGRGGAHHAAANALWRLPGCQQIVWVQTRSSRREPLPPRSTGAPVALAAGVPAATPAGQTQVERPHPSHPSPPVETSQQRLNRLRDSMSFIIRREER